MPVLAKYAREGYAIVSAVPSCTLMFKQELPLMFPDCADTQAVKAAMFDPFEYLVARHKDGLLKLDFNARWARSASHPCHGRVQNIGKKTRRCSSSSAQGRGQAHHRRALLRSRRYLRREDADAPDRDEDRQARLQAMAAPGPDAIASDCPMAGHHIAQGMQQAGAPAAAVQHLLTLLRRAYGL